MKSWFISISETEVSSHPLCREKGERPNASTTADSKKMTKHFMHSSTPQPSFRLGPCFNMKSMFYQWNVLVFFSLKHSTSLSLSLSIHPFQFLTSTVHCQSVHKIQGSVSCLKFSTSPQIHKHKYSRAEQKCPETRGKSFVQYTHTFSQCLPLRKLTDKSSFISILSCCWLKRMGWRH